MTPVAARPTDLASVAIFAIASLLVVAGAVAVVGFVRDPVSITPICAFGDGKAYCAAAEGDRIPEAFSRRPVVPALARLLPTATARAFRAISALGLLVAIALAVILADRIARRLDLWDRSTRVAIGIIVAGAGLVAPHGLRMAWSVPILVDHASLAAGLLWLVLFTSRNRYACMLSVPVTFLAGCTREIWGPVIAVTALSALVVDRRRAISAANVVVAVAALITVTRLVPPIADQAIKYSEREVIEYSWNQNFGSVDAVRHTAWRLAFAMGLLPLVLLLRPPLSWLRRELAQRDDTAAAVLLTAILVLGSALVAGTDLTRYLFPAGFLFVILAVPWLVSQRALLAPAVVLVLVTMAVWDPDHHLIATEAEYVSYYYGGPIGIGDITPPTDRTTRALAVSAAAFVVAVALTAVAAVGQSEEPSS
ncbi:MAG: hypothetical protein WKF43_03905 [Acidimicrobiales bacterium]